MSGWEQWKNGIFQKYLHWKTRPARLKRHLERNTPKLITNFDNLTEKKEQITVVALQLEMNVYQDILAFVDKMALMVDKSREKGADLIVFPEDNLLQLLGLLPGITGEQQGQAVDHFLSRAGEDLSITDILGFIGPIISKASLFIFAELAKRFQVYLMAGSGMLPGADGKIYNIAYLFGPDGELLGQQKKAHLLPLERGWGLASGDELLVVSTGIGRLAFPVCMDATYFETFRILGNQGAEIVMIPIANPDAEYNYWTALRGIWSRVQESRVFGIKSAMVGELFGFKFTGQAGIYAPFQLTAGSTGIIAEASTFDREELVVAELNLKELRELRVDDDCNLVIWEELFPRIYREK